MAIGEIKARVVVVTINGTIEDFAAAMKGAVKEALQEREQDRAAERIVEGIKGQLRTTTGVRQ